MRWAKIPTDILYRADKEITAIAKYSALCGSLERTPTLSECLRVMSRKQYETVQKHFATLSQLNFSSIKSAQYDRDRKKSENPRNQPEIEKIPVEVPVESPAEVPLEVPVDREERKESTPPIIPPKGDPNRFISLWNILSDAFRKRYPGNRPIPRLSSGREVPDLYRRTQDLTGLLKDLKRDPAFATEFEEKYEDAWSWAFHQMWQCITESQFLRGETKPNDQHPKPFVFKVSFVMRKKNFMALISPNDPTYKRCQV